jgi:hypothetical protein
MIEESDVWNLDNWTPVAIVKHVAEYSELIQAACDDGSEDAMYCTIGVTVQNGSVVLSKNNIIGLNGENLFALTKDPIINVGRAKAMLYLTAQQAKMRRANGGGGQMFVAAHVTTAFNLRVQWEIARSPSHIFAVVRRLAA